MNTFKSTRRNVYGVGRRKFMALGAAGALAPFIPRGVRAQTSLPRRLVFFCTNTGMTSRYPYNYRPVGAERDFSFPVNSILEPLQRGGGRDWRPLLTIPQGIDQNAYNDTPNIGGGHPRGMRVMLTGHGESSITVDQLIAQRIGDRTRLPSLPLGVGVREAIQPQSRAFWSGPNQAVNPDIDPASVYTRLFGQGGGTDLADRIARERRSVIDLVRDRLAAVTDGVGKEAQWKIERHLEALRTIERQVTGPNASACALDTAPRGYGDVMEEASIPAISRLQLQMIVAALACDQTRVAGMQWGHAFSSWRFGWLPDGQLSATWHALSHYREDDETAQAELLRAHRWMTEQFRYLLELMDAVPEGDGTLLDHSLVVWTCDNAMSRRHEWRNMPYVIAGGGGGYLSPGRFVTHDGVPHNRLLTSLAHYMGLEDVETVGDLRYGTGTLNGFARG